MAQNALLLAAGTLASRLLGMARETLIAASFDRGATDAFFLAWRLPNALRALLAEGAAAAALNPLLSKALEDKALATDEERRAAMRAVLAELSGAAFLTLACVTALGIAFARPLFGLLAGGLRADPERFELGVQLLRVLFPYIFFMGWFALGNTALRLLNVFRPGAFAPVMLNVAFVLAPFAFTPPLVKLGIHPVFALAGAALLGGLLQVLWLRPALRAAQMLPRPVLRDSPSVRRLGVLFVPLVYGQAVYQLNTILAGNFLASQPRGAASYFSYAQRLADIPQGLFAVALASSAAVAMQKHASRKELDGVAKVYEDAVRKTAVIALPFAVLLAAYADAVVPLVFSYGHFGRTAGAAHEVAASLRLQAISVALNAFVLQTTAVFSALEQRRQVVRCATAGLAVFAVVGYFATRALGHTGVALAMMASSGVQLALLVGSLRGTIPARFERVFPTIAKALAATGVMALAARAVTNALPVAGTGLAHRALAVLCGGALVGLYLAIAWALRTDEIRALADKVLARLRRRAPPGASAAVNNRSAAGPLDVLRADFLAEARTTEQIPAPGPLEVALAGRSNVGKSTLLNALAQRRSLARVSRTPGCTRGVILYEFGLRDGRALRVTDLPGYGFASRSHDERRGWGPLIEGYLTQREALGGVVILVDARRGPEQEELDLSAYLALHGVPFLLAATKIDKLTRSERGAALATITRTSGVRVVGTSGETGEGREELLKAMLRWSVSPQAASAPEAPPGGEVQGGTQSGEPTG